MFQDCKIIKTDKVWIVAWCPKCKTHIRIIFGQECCKCP